MKSLESYSNEAFGEMVLFSAFTLTKWTVRLPDDVEAPNLLSDAYSIEPEFAAFSVKLHSSILAISDSESEEIFSICKAAPNVLPINLENLQRKTSRGVTLVMLVFNTELNPGALTRVK